MPTPPRRKTEAKVKASVKRWPTNSRGRTKIVERKHARTHPINIRKQKPTRPPRPPVPHLNRRRPLDALRLQRAQHRLRQLHLPERLDRRRYFISLSDRSHSETIRLGTDRSVTFHSGSFYPFGWLSMLGFGTAQGGGGVPAAKTTRTYVLGARCTRGILL